MRSYKIQLQHARDLDTCAENERPRNHGSQRDTVFPGDRMSNHIWGSSVTGSPRRCRGSGARCRAGSCRSYRRSEWTDRGQSWWYRRGTDRRSGNGTIRDQIAVCCVSAAGHSFILGTVINWGFLIYLEGLQFNTTNYSQRSDIGFTQFIYDWRNLFAHLMFIFGAASLPDSAMT